MSFFKNFGVQNANYKLGEIQFKCVGCTSNKARFHKLQNIFVLFSFPIYKYAVDHVIHYQKCNSVYEIKNDSAIKVYRKKTATYDDIKSILIERGICPYCDTPYRQAPSNCPSCGKEL
ncbi:zinc-ribbon domain-containing protein [Fusobacterium varium]|uniref:zinc-ribbon domain-containing protein n=1 Tax=Fusobacterium varium TaxID=856 RepID=UPI000E515E32|nr:zinc-ribbon domain-containing protein [Fusobacterium varium]RHG34413.1 zinc-ribbon domain-containing protein [Fusobacterium varium]